jgi:hypothetical protein
MRAATLAAGGARWVWVWVWVGDAVRCDAMRCDAPRRRAVLGTLHTGEQQTGCRGGGVSVAGSARAESRAVGAASTASPASQRSRGRGWPQTSGTGWARAGAVWRAASMHTGTPNHDDSTKRPHTPSFWKPASRRPAASENQCDARCATAPAPPFPAHAASASVACHPRRLRGSRAAPRHASPCTRRAAARAFLACRC